MPLYDCTDSHPGMTRARTAPLTMRSTGLRDPALRSRVSRCPLDVLRFDGQVMAVARVGGPSV